MTNDPRTEAEAGTELPGTDELQDLPVPPMTPNEEAQVKGGGNILLSPAGPPIALRAPQGPPI